MFKHLFAFGVSTLALAGTASAQSFDPWSLEEALSQLPRVGRVVPGNHLYGLPAQIRTEQGPPVEAIQFPLDAQIPKRGADRRSDFYWYFPAYGQLYLVVTSHPFRSDLNGKVDAPGDCILRIQAGYAAIPQNVRNWSVLALDPDGVRNDLQGVSSDGKVFRIYLRSLTSGTYRGACGLTAQDAERLGQ